MTWLISFHGKLKEDNKLNIVSNICWSHFYLYMNIRKNWKQKKFGSAKIFSEFSVLTEDSQVNIDIRSE